MKTIGKVTVVRIDPAKSRHMVQSLGRQALAICVSLVIALSLPLRALAQREESYAFRHEIKPGKIAEECRNLASDELVRYRFEGSATVPFNVHFHRGTSVEYPVKIEKTSDVASIMASSAQDFCSMWMNETAETVVVRGELVRMN
jgi:hypothetical protein